MNQINYFAEDTRLSKLSKIGDPLEKITGTVDFEKFRPALDEVYQREQSDKGGRPAWDNVLMFKIMLLQEWYAISDDATEFLINDRLSFQRFLKLTLSDKVPDAKTIWLYREKLKNSGKSKALFDFFTKSLEETGVITRSGSIVDASFVDVPKQRNTREENKKIKEGTGKDLWEDNKHKSSQKDIDARWTKKNNETHFGYKDHAKVDSASKILVDFKVTDAALHDSQAIVDLIDEKDIELYADSAYTGENLHEKIKEKNPNIKLKIHEKGYRNKPLTDEQKSSNKEKSKVRARVEHVFGFMTNSMGGMTCKVIGIERITTKITLKNLAYNIKRFTFLASVKKSLFPIR
jgi:transposase, IS5 family